MERTGALIKRLFLGPTIGSCKTLRGGQEVGENPTLPPQL
jgi:hypothetical protein